MSSHVVGKGGRVPPPTRKLVIRKANSQRDLRAITERLSLEKVLGITSSSNASLACHPTNGIVAYPAGCTVILFNPRRSKQEFIHNIARKTISALTFSNDGKYLATGESGHMPSVRVWSIEDDSHPQISEMAKGHKHGISCVAFSPNLKYLVSVGYLHDMLINVWNWRDGSTVACNKFSTKVYAISFSELGDFFVTSGVRHVKFWYFDTEDTKSKHNKTIPIKGRAGLLGEFRNHTFCDVACGVGSNSDYTYCVTTVGALCCFNAKRKLEKFVEIESSKARCMAVDEKHLICGYTNGYIRVFDASSLEFVATLPKPHYLGVNVADGINPSHMIAKTDDVTYGDTVAIAWDNNQHRLTCVYSDHSLYVWDLKDLKKVGKIWSSLYHSACVWGLEVYPNVCQPGDSKDSPLPPGTFVTCSNDGTVRVWNVAEGMPISSVKNIYSKELLRILYVGQSYSNLKDPEMNPTSKNVRDVSIESKGGVRCISASPDGQLLAVGERSGNIRVYDCMFLDEILNIDAHESEVLCIEFSPPESGYKLLASAGRDRLIHIFDLNKEFALIQTIDDHSASITSVKFSIDESCVVQLLSCSADKSVIFRTAQNNPDLQFVRNTNYVGKTTLYDMVIDSSRRVAAVACQDRNIRVYDSHTGKQTKLYKGAQSDDGTLVKITMDNSGYFTATSCSDKSCSLYEFDTGECMATMSGHSEIVTGMRFTNDLKKLITVSGDGCIFIWAIPTTYTQYMTDRLGALGQELPSQIQLETPLRRCTYRVDSNPIAIEDINGFDSPSKDFLDGNLELDPPPVADYRFSIGQLPSWAKKQIIAGDESTPASSEQVVDASPSNTDTQAEIVSPVLSEQSVGASSTQPGGRWAQTGSNIEIQIITETSPQRPSSLALDISSPERKKFSIGSHAWQEQVDVLSKSPLERKCSLTSGEDDDLFSVSSKSTLEDVREERDEFKTKINHNNIPAHITTVDQAQRSRKWSGNLVFLETEEIKFEKAEEAKQDDVKENIIYFPQSQDEMECETANTYNLFPGVKEMARRFELLQASRPWHNLIHSATQRQDRTKCDVNKIDFKPVKIEKLARSFQVTSAQKPERRSVDDEDQVEEKNEDKRKCPESSGDEEDDLSSPLEEVKDENDMKASEKPSDPDDDDGEGEEVCKKYFDCLASTPTKETPPDLEPQPPTPEAIVAKTEKKLPFLNGRLSISARFLSRSLLSRGQNNLDTVSEDVRTSSLEEHKLEIQRRREEMARAVDVNRKRLTALRKAKEERELRHSQESSHAISAFSITLKPSPRRISLDMDHTSSTTLTPAINTSSVKQHRSISSPFPVPFEQLRSGLDDGLSTQPERFEPNPEKIPSTSDNNAVNSLSFPITPLATNLFETQFSSLSRHAQDQLIPERDESVWIKRDEKEKQLQPLLNQFKPITNKTLSVTSKDEKAKEFGNEQRQTGRPKQKESDKENQLLIAKAEEMTREPKRKPLKDNEKEREIAIELDRKQKEREEEERREREREKERETAKQEESVKQKERDRQLQEQKDREKQQQLEKENAKKEELEREKQKEIEKAKAEELLREKEKHRELEKERQRKIEKVKAEEREKEIQKQKEKERERQREIEKAKAEELLREKQKQKEREKEKEIQKENEREKGKQKEIEKAKRDDKDKPEKKDEREAEKKDENKEINKDKKEKTKLEKRGSFSSLMAPTKSSWRKNLGFHGFSSKSKDKKDERHASTPFASTLRSSDYHAQLAKRSEKVLFRDKKGKLSSEDRKLKSRSVGDLDSRLRPLREEIILGSSNRPASRVQSTVDITKEIPKVNITSENPNQGSAAAVASHSNSLHSLPLQDDDKKNTSPSPPFPDRRSPIGRDGENKSVSRFQMYQDAVSQLDQAIKSITDLHSQVLEEDNSDDKEEMLSLLTNTLTDTEEHCKQLRLRSTEAFKAQNPSKPFVSNFSYSMNNLDSLGGNATTTNLNRRASEACVPTAVEQDASDLLMRYSDILVEMVKQKLGN